MAGTSGPVRLLRIKPGRAQPGHAPCSCIFAKPLRSNELLKLSALQSQAMIATMTYERCDAPQELKQDDIDGLHGAVMETLNRHFSDFDQAAGAFETYRRVRADINADTTLPLFGVLEAFQAALAAHPDAKEWAAFESEAAAKIAPFCFSIQFTG